MKKKCFLILMSIVYSSILCAQDVKISGQVSDPDGNSLPGVSILIEGTTTGTETDFDGNYTMQAQQGSTLVFSFVGMISQKISVTGESTMNVTMAVDASQLDEVVVVGYGTQSKKDITGSIATVDGSAITNRSTTNISSALQGAVAGVMVTRSSSAPGSSSSSSSSSSSTIRIRGNTSLQGSNSPLILVDDVPVSSIDVVPSDQVESITILKDDAAVAAIYGSRAAAGVIIITTKRTKKGVFTDFTEIAKLNTEMGWWFSVESANFDNDGDMDLIAGNLGLNSKYKTSVEEPFEVYSKDFDGTGILDIVLGYHQDGKLFPLRGR
jgi:TonB-dependent SusC/RagA subfamily outer membrane receptor